MLSAMIGGSFTTMAFQGLQIPIIIIIIIIIEGSGCSCISTRGGHKDRGR